MKLLKFTLMQMCVWLLVLGMANAAWEFEDEVIQDEVIQDEVVEDEVIEDEVIEDEVIEDQEVTFSLSDWCTNATELSNVTNLPFNTIEATFDGRGLCMISPNIWFLYTAPCTGEVVASLAGSSYDTMLAVYMGGECYPTQDDLVACNDDFGGTCQSQVTFDSTANEQYLIEVGGYGVCAGSGFITISCEGESSPPASGDSCWNAQPVGDVIDLPFDTTNAAFDGTGVCMVSPNIWYRYNATCTGDVTVSLLGSSYDTMLAIYEEWECYPTVSNLIECNDDYGDRLQSLVKFSATAGHQYLIEIGGYASQTGKGFLSISCEGVTVQEKPDLGDAPDRTNNSGSKMHAYTSPWIVAHYPTVFDDGSGVGPFGPVHLNNPLVAHLGMEITSETEADIDPDEDGINNINPEANSSNHDEGDDGVAMPLTLPEGDWATIDYEVTVIDPNAILWTNIWLDFNRDGDWDDTLDTPAGLVKEWAVQNQFLFNLPEGQTTVTTPAFLSAHPEDVHEEIWMRITLSEQPWMGGSNPGERGNAGSGPQDMYAFGETEDYFFIPEIKIEEDCPLCRDIDENGVINTQDLIVLVHEWLATCQ